MFLSLAGRRSAAMVSRRLLSTTTTLTKGASRACVLETPVFAVAGVQQQRRVLSSSPTTTPPPSPSSLYAEANDLAEPVKPKRATGSYMFFCRDVRHNSPATKFRAEQLGEMWIKLSADEKRKYAQMAVEDKARYEKEKEAYEAKHGKLKNNSKKEKKVPAPKKITGYQYYLRVKKDDPEFAEFADVSKSELKRAMSAKWKELSKEDQKPYKDHAKSTNEANLQDYAHYVNKVSV